MKFIRYGGLNAIKQKHYKTGENKTFHNPPVRKGFYAFPYPYIDKFLLTATNKPGHISNKSEWLKDDNNDKVKCIDFYNENWDIRKKWIKYLKYKKIKISNIYCIDNFIAFYKKPKIFDYNGLIWHHLDLNQYFIIKNSGEWSLSTMDNYIKLLKLEKHKRLNELNKINGKITGIIDPFKGPGLTFSVDELEVFIEKI